MNDSQDTALLGKIVAFELDEAGARFPFTGRLAREQGWTHVFAGRVIVEYERFVALAMMFPMLILLLIGIVKLFIGISRDKPVGFLLLFLLLTVIVGYIIASGRKTLTPAGDQLLGKMRGNPYGEGTVDATLCGVALLGISGMAYDESLVGIDAALKKEISRMGHASTASGADSGCSSGCGSGCGGGGCGGCGGCGGD